MKLFKNLAVAAGVALTMGAANATLVNVSGGEQSLQSIINGLYTAAGTPTSAAPDVNANQFAYDQQWAIEGSGTTAATFIIELAGNAASNTFGIYNLTDPTKRIELFGGAGGSADRAELQLFVDGRIRVNFTDYTTLATTSVIYAAGTLSGNSFGYYLGTSPTNTFYSQTSLNANGADQMVAYRGDGDLIALPGAFPGVWGPSSFILAWEDVAYGSSDMDFNDLVVYVESVTGLPEPGTLALVGLSLAGLGFASRRRKV